ncbi:MAG: 50S ribosomal protein L24 [Thermoplasmata archaeon]|nr:50S ribosomal protein L24 [Thermoplasmata archaeon]
MGTLSRQPRRQRKAVFTADSFERRRRMTLPLSRELRARYGRRQLPVRKGDTVRVLSGSYSGREERVAKIDRRTYSLTLDNVTGKTADQKLKALPIKPSHLVLTRLNLSDAWRRRVLNVAEAEAGPAESEEEESGPPTAAEDLAESAPAAPATPKTGSAEAPVAPKAPKRKAKPSEGA